jgi:acetolactate synthase I/II/III large subunit
MTEVVHGHGELRNGGALVVEWMRSRGLDAFFHVPGESFLPVLDALLDAPSIRVVTTRHEGGAAFAAEAFGKLTGRPAVCMATRGPGAANLSLGVQTAHYDGTPMIALLGLVPRRLQGSGAFQEVDPASMFASIAKTVQVVNSIEALVPVLDQALSAACAGRPGPAVVGFPADVLFETTGVGVPTTSAAPGVPAQFDPEEILSRLRAARRPAILAATEPVRRATAEALGDLAEAAGVPVYCSWRRFSSFDNGHEQFAGSVGLGADAAVTKGLSEADLVLSFGFGLEQVTCEAAGLGEAGAHVIQFAPAIDPRVPRYLPAGEVEQIVSDPRQAAEALAAAARETRFDQRIRVSSRKDSEERPPETPVSGERAVRLDHVMSCLDAILPADAIVTSDAGNFAQWMLRHIRFGRQRTFLGPLNGAMGYGLPAAVGAGIAAGSRPCWVLAGDGGFAMLEAEMETASRLGLSVVACVFDNGLYGTIRARQEQAFPGRAFGTSTGRVDFAAAAAAHGWRGWTVEKDADVEPVLAEVSAAGGCRLAHFIVEPFPLAV